MGIGSWLPAFCLSRDPDGLRATKFQHPVPGGRRGGDLGRLVLIAARLKGIADHAFVPADRCLDPGSMVVAAGLRNWNEVGGVR